MERLIFSNWIFNDLFIYLAVAEMQLSASNLSLFSSIAGFRFTPNKNSTDPRPPDCFSDLASPF